MRHDLPEPGKPTFRLRALRYPEDEISPFVRWDQFVFVFSPRDEQEQIDAAYFEAVTWCRDQFGLADGYRWQIRNSHICFSSRTDSAAFRLRWC